MPFDPRTKSRLTTTLPAALRDELGLPAPNAKRNFRRDARRKPQLKAIGRPQSAINGAAKGTPRGPIKSLRNQEKEQQSRHHRANTNTSNNASGSSSSSRSKHAQEPESKPPQKRKHEKQPKKELKVIKKAKRPSLPAQDEEEGAEPTQQKTRLNPFTGEMEMVKSTSRKSSSALEKMLAKVEAGPSSSQGKSKAADALGGGKKKSRHRMSQQEKEEEDDRMSSLRKDRRKKKESKAQKLKRVFEREKASSCEDP